MNVLALYLLLISLFFNIGAPAQAQASNYVSGTGEAYGYNSSTYIKSTDYLYSTQPGWYIVEYTISKDKFYDQDRVSAIWKNYASGSAFWFETFRPKGRDLPYTSTTSYISGLKELALEAWFNPGYANDIYRGVYISKVVVENENGETRTVYPKGEAMYPGDGGVEDPDPDLDPPVIYLVDKGRDYIKIAWGASEGATGYKIYKDGAHIGTVSGTNYTFAGLSPETSYGLKVKAYNNVGDSSFSNTLSVETDPIPSPENFRILDRGWYHIKTAWDPVSDVDGYKIYRNGSYISTTTNTNYEFSGLSEASLYELGVAAYKGAYQSEIKIVQSSTQGVTQGDEIIQLLQSYIPDTCSQIKQIWQQVTKDLPVIATNINAITENTGSIKNDVKKLKDYITTPRIAPALQTDPIPPISFDSTLPDISEPGQDPYIYDRPDPVMPSPITSPGPLPFAPDPTIMPHDEPILSAPPTQLDEPVLREDPRQQDPVIKEPPLVRDPISMDPPLAQDPVIKEPPLARDPASGMDPPMGREGPITADPPYTRTPPLGGG